MVDRKRPRVVIWSMTLLIGLAGFFRVMQSPGFAAYRAVDVVQLIVSGACFGAVMTGVISALREAR